MGNYKIHITGKEEKLFSIAEKYGTTSEAIKALNPNMKTFKGFIGGEFVSAMQQIKIPNQKEVSKTENLETNDIKFEKQARYRCEQTNITRVNEEVITLHAEIRTQYLYSLDRNNPACKEIVIEDYIFSVEPSNLKEAFNFAQEIESIKKRIVF